eukprot:TRINITY_DN41114_c0_g1_i1.p1 TRINITY_DN41114_c0_g1~~TRINITY_DN41114_c0_g1_i1.p1  ORF type:complete len:251 (-),score=54.88 TRINITY_DN41114_c0_g1_i1:73-798(-)
MQRCLPGSCFHGLARGFTAAKAPQLKLTYLDIKGVAEPIRLTLWLGGVAFSDERISYEEVAARRASGALPFGQVPVLEIDGKAHSQSQGLLRYAGRLTGLYPEDLQLEVDAVEEALVDIRKTMLPQWYGVMMGRDPVSGEKLVPLSEQQKRDVADALNARILPAKFTQLERVLTSSGGPYFCGKQLTTCDLSFYVMAKGIQDGSYIEGVSPKTLSACLKLLELVQHLDELPQIKKWNQRHS